MGRDGYKSNQYKGTRRAIEEQYIEECREGGRAHPVSLFVEICSTISGMV